MVDIRADDTVGHRKLRLDIKRSTYFKRRCRLRSSLFVIKSSKQANKANVSVAVPIVMPFGPWHLTNVGPRNHVLDGAHIPQKGALLGGHVTAYE